MMRCFSVCLLSHVGHLYVTSSYSNPYSSAMCGRKSLNRGESQFLMNQNLSRFRGVAPDAQHHDLQETLVQVAGGDGEDVDRLPAPRESPLPAAHGDPVRGRSRPRAPAPPVHRDLIPPHKPPRRRPLPSNRSTSSRSMPGRRSSASRTTRPFQLDTKISVDEGFSLEDPASTASSIPNPGLEISEGRRREHVGGGPATAYTSADLPGRSARSNAPGRAWSWKYPRLLMTTVPASPSTSCVPAEVSFAPSSTQCPATSSARSRYSARRSRSVPRVNLRV